MEKKEGPDDLEIKATSLSNSSNEEEVQKVVTLEDLSVPSTSSSNGDKEETAKSVAISDVITESITQSKPVRQEITLANRQTKHLASGTFHFRVML